MKKICKNCNGKGNCKSCNGWGYSKPLTSTKCKCGRSPNNPETLFLVKSCPVHFPKSMQNKPNLSKSELNKSTTGKQKVNTLQVNTLPIDCKCNCPVCLHGYHDAHCFSKQQNWEKEIASIVMEHGFDNPECHAKDVENLISQALSSQLSTIQKEIAEDICKLIDDIELSELGRPLEQWKEFKKIRNTIRDKYNL